MKITNFVCEASHMKFAHVFHKILQEYMYENVTYGPSQFWHHVYTVWIVYTVTHLLLTLAISHLIGLEPLSHNRLHTAVSRGIKCLSDTYLETDGSLHTAT